MMQWNCWSFVMPLIVWLWKWELWLLGCEAVYSDKFVNVLEEPAALSSIGWNLDLSFFKGMEKQNDECGKMINPGNCYTL